MLKNRKMKRLTALALCAVVLLCGCTSQGGGESVSDSSSKEYILAPEVNYAPSNFNYPLKFRLYNFSARVINLLADTGAESEKRFNTWIETFNSIRDEVHDPTKRPFTELNLINFVKDFQIPEEDFYRALEKDASDGYIAFTREEVAVLYHGDEEEIIKAFRNPWTVYHNGTVYTALMLTSMTAEELEEAGITAEMVRQAIYNEEDPREYYWQSIFTREQLAQIEALVERMES